MPRRIEDSRADFVMNMATDASVTILPLAEQMVSMGAVASNRTLRRRAWKRLHQCDWHRGPHGRLIEDIPVVGSAGTLQVKALNIFAYFYHAATVSVKFFDFMNDLIRRCGTLTIALYTDGVKPRNQSRPDKAGAFEAVRV